MLQQINEELYIDQGGTIYKLQPGSNKARELGKIKYKNNIYNRSKDFITNYIDEVMDRSNNNYNTVKGLMKGDKNTIKEVKNNIKDYYDIRKDTIKNDFKQIFKPKEYTSDDSIKLQQKLQRYNLLHPSFEDNLISRNISDLNIRHTNTYDKIDTIKSDHKYDPLMYYLTDRWINGKLSKEEKQKLKEEDKINDQEAYNNVAQEVKRNNLKRALVDFKRSIKDNPEEIHKFNKMYLSKNKDERKQAIDKAFDYENTLDYYNNADKINTHKLDTYNFNTNTDKYDFSKSKNDANENYNFNNIKPKNNFLNKTLNINDLDDDDELTDEDKENFKKDLSVKEEAYNYLVGKDIKEDIDSIKIQETLDNTLYTYYKSLKNLNENNSNIIFEFNLLNSIIINESLNDFDKVKIIIELIESNNLF